MAIGDHSSALKDFTKKTSIQYYYCHCLGDFSIHHNFLACATSLLSIVAVIAKQSCANVKKTFWFHFCYNFTKHLMKFGNHIHIFEGLN